MTSGQYWQGFGDGRIPYKRRFVGAGLDFAKRSDHMALALLYAVNMPPSPNDDRWDSPDALGPTGL